MTREIMLEKLHTIKPGVELTVLPNEEALECEYVTKEGCSYEWIGMYDWPVVVISNIQKLHFGRIKEKLSRNSLAFSDIEGTQFRKLFSSFIEQDSEKISDTDAEKILNYSFRALQNIDLSVSGEIFAMFDSYAEKPTFAFFADYDSMATAFSENYIEINTRWEDFEDEDLAQWLARLENDFQGIPFGRFDLEDDTE